MNRMIENRNKLSAILHFIFQFQVQSGTIVRWKNRRKKVWNQHYCVFVFIHYRLLYRCTFRFFSIIHYVSFILKKITRTHSHAHTHTHTYISGVAVSEYCILSKNMARLSIIRVYRHLKLFLNTNFLNF